MEQEVARIPSNGIHKSEPQYYHIKDIRVVMISAIVGTSFLAAISIDCFKIAQILFSKLWTKSITKAEKVIVRILKSEY